MLNMYMCNSDKRHNSTVCHALLVSFKLEVKQALGFHKILQPNVICNSLSISPKCFAALDHLKLRGLHYLKEEHLTLCAAAAYIILFKSLKCYCKLRFGFCHKGIFQAAEQISNHIKKGSVFITVKIHGNTIYCRSNPTSQACRKFHSANLQSQSAPTGLKGNILQLK